MKFGIICGHGNGDPGASSTVYGTEANMVRQLAPFIQRYLVNYADTVIFDTSRNWYEFLKTNSYSFSGFDYIIELHGNAGAHDQSGNGVTTGIEVWVTSSEEGITVEQNICTKISDTFGMKNRGVKVTDFFVIRTIKDQGISSCLIENGFIDDKDDMKIIFSNMEGYCKTLAEAIAEGFGLKRSTVSPIIMYCVQCGPICTEEEANELSEELKDNGYNTYIMTSGDDHYVQAGAYTVFSNAESLVKKLAEDGFDAKITTKQLQKK